MTPRRIQFFLFTMLLAGCSGVIAVPGSVVTVHPAHLQQFSRGGSMSTLWYDGSDSGYHYFRRSYKVSTRYRIHRSELDWDSEFPLGSQKPVFCSPRFQDLPHRNEHAKRGSDY